MTNLHTDLDYNHLLKILPNKKDPTKIDRDFEYGSFIKMFDYDIGPTLRSRGNMDLYYRLSLLLISPTQPLRIYESRKVKANTPINNMSGLLKSIETDRGKNIENNFHEVLKISNQTVKVGIYVLTEDTGRFDEFIKKKKYHRMRIFGLNHSFFF